MGTLGESWLSLSWVFIGVDACYPPLPCPRSMAITGCDGTVGEGKRQDGSGIKNSSGQ